MSDKLVTIQILISSIHIRQNYNQADRILAFETGNAILNPDCITLAKVEQCSQNDILISSYLVLALGHDHNIIIIIIIILYRYMEVLTRDEHGSPLPHLRVRTKVD